MLPVDDDRKLTGLVVFTVRMVGTEMFQYADHFLADGSGPTFITFQCFLNQFRRGGSSVIGHYRH